MSIEISTPRLKLRQLQESDIDNVANLDADKDVRAFFPDGTLTKEKSLARMRELMSFYDKYKLPCFVILNKETGDFVGRCGFGKIETGEIEVGYLIEKKSWGQGIASEALSAVLHWAKEHINADYIIAFSPEKHLASQRVMQKCGMEYYKNDIGHGVPCCFYRSLNLSTQEKNAASSNVSSVYDEISDWFDEHRNRELIESGYLELIRENIPKNSNVLDLGCGMGEPIAQFFIEHGHYVTGVDGSSMLINKAKHRYPSASWMVQDMRTIDLNKQFDCILSWHSLFHLSCDDQIKMFPLFKKHAAPGCILVFTSAPEHCDAHWSDNGGKALYHASLSEREYKKLLLENDFQVIKYCQKDPDCGDATVWVAQKEE